jgi:hypothetical protein
MFNHYYAKQEQYKDFIKEAEKERIINEIKKAEQEKEANSSSDADLSPSSWLEKLSLIFSNQQLSSPESPK